MTTQSSYPADQLRNFAADVFRKTGVPDEDAALVADALVESNLRAVDSHGVRLLPLYAKRVMNGLINPRPKMSFTETRAGTGLLDADTAFGHLAAIQAMDHAIELARRTGVGTVVVKRSTHFGAAGYYTLRAARHDMIGILHAHGDTCTVPFGGKTGYLGTNPYSVAAPTGRRLPFVMDMATSQVAFFRLKAAIDAAATQIPADWAVDGEGRAVTDPTEAVLVSPLGGAKGWALGLMVEIFSAMLGGAMYGPQLVDQSSDFENAESLSHFVQAIDPTAFVPIDEFKARIDEMFDQISAQPATDDNPYGRVLIPGERGFEERDRRLRDGVPLADNVIESLRELGQELGIAFAGPASSSV